MRQRWSAGGPDRTPADGSGRGGRDGWREVDERIRREFLAGAVVIDCPYADCPGVYVTERREIQRPPGTGTRVVLRCTRRPEDHDHAISLAPYSPEQREELKLVVLRGVTPACPHCGTPLERDAVNAPGTRGTPVESAVAYSCPWCGVAWLPPGEVRERIADADGEHDDLSK